MTNYKETYYLNKAIAFNIIAQLKDKETCFIPIGNGKPIRWKKSHAIVFLNKHFERYKFLTTKMNLYHSLAHYKDMPMMSYDTNKQIEQQKEWAKVFHAHITAYDFFIETDSQDLNKSLADALEIKNLFDKYNLRYSVMFSGSKGFHFLINYEEFQHLSLPIYFDLKDAKWEKYISLFPMPINNLKGDIVRLYKAICYRIRTLFSLDTVDLTITDIKRVKKVGYSLDDKSGLVAYPLDDKQLANFNKLDYSPDKVLWYNNYFRGMLIRNDNKIPKTNDFLRDLGIIY